MCHIVSGYFMLLWHALYDTLAIYGPAKSITCACFVYYYQVISESIRQVFPGIGIAPGMMIGGTDSKHYLNLTSSVYRFYPSILTPKDFKTIHGVNERISVKNYEQTINYFYHLMVNADNVPQQATPKQEL